MYYLAYGSNLNLRQMKTRCPGAIPYGVAEIADYRLLFKGSKTGSYLTIEKKVGSRVPIVIWDVSKENESSLDRYEGCPTFYYKEWVDISLTNPRTKRKKKIKAFIYIMHEDRSLGIPSELYMETCREGYRNFEFDEAFLDKALEDSLQEGSECMERMKRK